MNIASTIQQVREAKSNNGIVKVDVATNKATDNGTATANSNSNAAVAQTKEVVKPDTVTLSRKSVALASTAKTDSASRATATPTAVTTATKSEPKVEETTKQVAAVEKSKGTKANFRQAMMKSQSELRSTVNGLTKAGVSSRKIGNMIRT
ncbi:MAG: hypothetical protein ACUZ8I_12415, partial [Candidatus Scalindua sp.]